MQIVPVRCGPAVRGRTRPQRSNRGVQFWTQPVLDKSGRRSPIRRHLAYCRRCAKWCEGRGIGYATPANEAGPSCRFRPRHASLSGPESGSAGQANAVSQPWADEPVGKPDSVTRRERRGAIIHLRPLLPAAWCDLPGGSGEQPSGASADARTRPLDLAPGGVCRATPVAWGAGGLLHHRFTLTSEEAVCSLWHFPAGHPGWALPTTVLCGVRTFLDPPRKADRDRLTDSSEIQANGWASIDETRRDLGEHELDADLRI